MAYPSATATNNVSVYPDAAIGLVYQQDVHSASNEVVGSVVNDYQCFLQAVGAWHNPIWVRNTRVQSIVDGVKDVRTTEFEIGSGQARKRTRRNVDPGGLEQLLVSEYQYFWEVYDISQSLNLLTPIVQKTDSIRVNTTDTVLARKATTWKQGLLPDNNIWSDWATFRAYENTGPFTEWSSGSVPVDWYRTTQVLKRSAVGNVIELIDLEGSSQSFIYDNSGLFFVASAQHASVASDEFSYYGFETYEVNKAWRWSKRGSPIGDHIVASEHHTGSRCLMVPPSQQGGPTVTVSPANQAASYNFGNWYKTPDDYNSELGVSEWQIQAYLSSDNLPVGDVKKVPVAASHNKWVKQQTTVDLAAIRAQNQIVEGTSLYLVIVFNNANPKAVYLDNLRWQLTGAMSTVTVYDSVGFRNVANMDTNLSAGRIVFDNKGNAVAVTSPNERVISLTQISYSRELSDSNRFLAEFPNSQLTLQTTSDSLYYDFSDTESKDWSFYGGNWAVADDELSYAPSDSPSTISPLVGAAQFKVFAFTNFAIRIKCKTDSTGKAGIGNGDIFAIYDGSVNQWTLTQRQSNDTYQTLVDSQRVGLGSSWVLSLVEGIALFYVDGIQVFAQPYIPNTQLSGTGKPVLTLDQNGTFDDLLVLNDPQISLSFTDARGSYLQDIRYVGTQDINGNPTHPVQSGGILSDNAGRPYIKRRPVKPHLKTGLITAAADATAQLIEANIDTYLVTPEGAQISVSDYVSGADGVIDYEKVTFENSPLQRPIAVVQPHSTEQGADKNTVHIRYFATAESGDGAIFNDILGPNTAGNFSIQETIDQDGTKEWVLRDLLNRDISQRKQTGATSYHTETVVYDLAGNPTMIAHPNFYAPPTGSDPNSWKATGSFNYVGDKLSKTTPDSGTSLYLYDSSSRLRFWMLASGALSTPQKINYQRFDSFGRLVEVGEIADQSIVWGSQALSGQLANPAFPNVTDENAPNFVLGRWSRRMHYDTDPNSGESKNSLTLLTSVQTRAIDGTIETATMRYNALGQIVEHQSQIEGVDTNLYITKYTYDNLGNQSSVVYPDLEINEPFIVGSYRDRLGRLASVGDVLNGNEVIDPENPADAGERFYASYSYTPVGLLMESSYNNGKGNPPGQSNTKSFQRRYSYNKSGWLEQVSDPFCVNTIDYQTPSNPDNHNGNIARLGYQYLSERWLCPPEDYVYDYSYDKLNRLTHASNNIQDAWSYQIGEDGYDANGNIINFSRGSATTSHSYIEVDAKRVNNQLQKSATSFSATFDFGTDAMSNRWSWGPNNNGPAMSQVVEDADKGKVLALAAGTPGHFEHFRLLSYLDPGTSYEVTYQVKNASTFASNKGLATWYLSLTSAAGDTVVKAIQNTASTSGVWEAQSISIDLPTILAELGFAKDASFAKLSLVNRSFLPANGDDAAVYITSPIVVSVAPSETGLTTYSADGQATNITQSGTSGFIYDTTIERIASAATAELDTVKFYYDQNGMVSYEAIYNNQNELTLSRRYLRDSGGAPLVVVEKVSGQPMIRRYVHGVEGIIASIDPDQTKYTVRDYLGSLRYTVDQDSGLIVEGFDYDPWGAENRQSGKKSDSAESYRFGGHEYNDNLGVYNVQARLYDPRTSRFLQTDPASQFPSPYVYAGSNPISNVDPDGQFTIAAVALGFGVWTIGSKIYENWDQLSSGQMASYIAIDVASVGVGSVFAGLIGGVSPFVGHGSMNSGHVKPNPWAVNFLNFVIGATGSVLSTGISQSISQGTLKTLQASNNPEIWKQNNESYVQLAMNETSSDFIDGFASGAKMGALSFTVAAGSNWLAGYAKLQWNLYRHGDNFYATAWTNRNRDLPAKSSMLDSLHYLELTWIDQNDHKLFEKFKTHLRKPGGLHEWLEVALFWQARRFGWSVEQVQRATTAIGPGSMFLYLGQGWAHKYNAAHRVNTWIIKTAAGPLPWRVMLSAYKLAYDPTTTNIGLTGFTVTELLNLFNPKLLNA